jgi:hypothetical protein
VTRRRSSFERSSEHQGAESSQSSTLSACPTMKIEIGRTTVTAVLAEAGLEPALERTPNRTWKHFLKSHWDTLYACDFFSVETEPSREVHSAHDSRRSCHHLQQRSRS